MATMVIGSVARCALCRAGVDRAGHDGRDATVHAVLFRTHGSGEGVLLCDDCAMLAAMDAPVTRN